MEARMHDHTRVYETIPGGLELLAWFNDDVSFGDAEIVSFELQSRGISTLAIHWWRSDGSPSGNIDHAVVIFEFQGISDLQLSGFSQQNVIGGLKLSKRTKDPERERLYDFCATENDFHLDLLPCYGIDGFIRCNSISVRVAPRSRLDISSAEPSSGKHHP